MRKMFLLPGLLVGVLAASTVEAQLPTVNTGGSVFVYAEFSAGPGTISFDASDNLFVGNYNTPGDPGVAVSVWFVDAIDSSVSMCATIDDPDAVYVDRNGLLTVPGGLLVGGLDNVTDIGRIMRVLPTCGGVQVRVSGGFVNNVSMFAEDALGNLYIANAVGNIGPSRTISKWDGLNWSQFLPTQATDPFIAIDGTDIYVSVSGVTRRYNTLGSVVDPSFATGNVVGIGPAGSDFEGVIVARTGMLLAVDPVTKAETPILTGPASTGFVAFDSQGDLYVAQGGELNRVIHVTQCNKQTAAASPEQVVFAVVPAFETTCDTVYVENTGCETILIDEISGCGVAPFSIDTTLTSHTLAPGESTPIVVCVTPTSHGPLYCTLAVMSSTFNSPLIVPVQVDAVTPVETSPRHTFDIVGVVPNPFNPNTSVRFTLPSPMDIDAGIWSVTGERVALLARNQAFPAGESEIRWDGRNDQGQRVASGVYFFRLTSPVGGRVARLVLIE